MRLAVIPSALKRHRLERGLSRRQLAEATRISKRRIEALERETAVEGVRPETAQALAAALGCTASDLTEVVEVAS